MPIPVITYGELSQLVLDYILANAKNLDDKYNDLPAPFKPGYTVTYSYGELHATASLVIGIKDTVIQTTTNTITSQFNLFLNTYGMTSISDINIQDAWYPIFINNLLDFAGTKGAFAVCQFNSNRYYIYDPTQNVFNHSLFIEQKSGLDIISTSDVTHILTTIQECLHSVTRLIPCTYTFEVI